MPRRPRLDPTDGLHHVWNRGVAKADVFFADSDRIEFGRQLHQMYEQFGIVVIAYCLMSNHYHLLVRCPLGGLSDAMQRLGSLYTRHVNDQVGRDGPLFRGRFKSRLVLSHEYIVCLVRYIHRNALDVSGITSVEQYRWSSHRTYIGARSEPPWLSTQPVLNYFDGDRQAFHDYVIDDRTPATSAPNESTLDGVIAATEVVLGQATASDIEAARLGRTIMVLVLDDLPTDQQWDLAQHVGISSKAAWRMARMRARATERERPEVAGMVAAVRQLALSSPWERSAA